MLVTILESLYTPDYPFLKGKQYEVTDTIGQHWIDAGLAAPTNILPPANAELYQRLEPGAGKACLFLPFVGEFGHQVMTHIRIVHWHKAKTKTVCCRKGEEVLYPSAKSFVTDWVDPIPDEWRVASNRTIPTPWPKLVAKYPRLFHVHAGALTPEQELVAINPAERIPFKPKLRGLKADVVLGVRHRQLFTERNWPAWHRTAEALTAQGISFAVIGAKPTSLDLPGQVCHSGDLDTDAAVELLQNCRLYVGTDSGNSHLASTVGCEMLLFREEQSGSRNLVPRMEQVNPGRIQLVPDGWKQPGRVFENIISSLKAKK